MVNELQFDNNDNLYPLYQQNREVYNQFLELHGIPLHPELIERAKKTPAVHQQPTPSPAQNVPVVAGGEE
jgi:hypothetical protein